MKIVHRNMDILLRSLQILVPHPFLHDRRMPPPSVERMRDVGVSEGVNRHILVTSETLYLPTDVITHLASSLREKIESEDIICALLLELVENGFQA